MAYTNDWTNFSDEELLTFLEQVVHQLIYRKTVGNSSLPQVDNLFELLEKKNVKTKDFVRKWNAGKYDGWYRLRGELKKLSVERIAVLAQVLAVPPAYLFQLILDSYPKNPEGYDFSKYRPEVQASLEKEADDRS